MSARDGDQTWDLVVVGGGTAGIVAARTAARFGASVLLVERARTGGDCLWTGCVPSKALLAAAHAAASARASAALGVTTRVRVDGAAVLAHVRSAIAAIAPEDAPETLEAAGVRVRSGEARFVADGVLEVDGEEVSFRQAVVATGSAPTRVAGIDGWTSETFWDVSQLPERVLVVGGGPIGCELGQALARLGSQVTLVQRGPRLLPAEDSDAAAVVTTALRADGVDVRCSTTVLRLEDGLAVLDDGTELTVDGVLVAVGRTPRTADLGLETVGVELGAGGHVVVDERLRTTNPRIWAAGDVTAVSRFTHTAGVHGSTLAANAILGLRRAVDPVVPRVTFTQPEVAAVGSAAGHAVRTVAHHETDRAIAEGETVGFSRLVLDRRGRLVGATVVGPRAGESLAELTLAVRQGLRARDLAATTHPYPTWGDAGWNAAVADVRAGLEGRVVGRAVRVLGALRRRWLR